MSMGKNIMIPLSLFDQIIDVLECCELAQDDIIFRGYHDRVLYELQQKKRKLELRDDYAKIINAKSDDVRAAARIGYLQNKRWLDMDFADTNDIF